MLRRELLTASLTAALAAPALAQGWSPARSVRLIATYAPGGSLDAAARLLSGPLGTTLGQSVVVENRAGAGGSIAAAEVARSAPDGLTVMLDALAHTVNPALMRNLSFDYATAFTPISLVVIWPLILNVHPSLPVRNLQEFIAYVRARPGQISYGSAGNATAAHMASALLLHRAGLEMVHVPYRGAGPAMQDLVAGNLGFVFSAVVPSIPLAQEGRVRPLAISSGTRLAGLPDIGTVAEQGFPGYELNEWNGIFGPAGMPEPIVTRWFEAVKSALADPAVRSRLEGPGGIPVGNEPDAFAAHVREQREMMARLVRETRMELG